VAKIADSQQTISINYSKDFVASKLSDFFHGAVR
jgi:hypothetical protein